MLVYNYLKSLCNNCDIAEELTQETFYKAIKGIDKFNNECKVSTWLCKIAKNTWIDFLRKKEKENFISIDNEEVIQNFFSSKSIKNNIEDSEDIINLYKYIHKLDENTKEVFYLRLNADLSFRNIGEILDKSEEWARMAFYRGKMKLKEAMKNDEKRV